MNQVLVDVKKTLDDVGAAQRISFSRQFEPIIKGPEKIEFHEPVLFDLNLENLGEELRLTGIIKGALALVCSRCLRQFNYHVEADIDEIIAGPGKAAEEPYKLRDDTLDVGPIAEEHFLLAVPMKPLCDEACAGVELPKKAEHDKATEKEEEIDERLKILERWFDSGEESGKG